jgi:hypothetical protein
MGASTGAELDAPGIFIKPHYDWVRRDCRVGTEESDMTADNLLARDEMDRMSGAAVLSSSGPRLPGLLIMRTAFERRTDMVAVAPGVHLVVAHDNGPVELRYRAGRRVGRSVVPPGHANVNPAD